MITRSKMRRQLYRGGGITRQRYGLGDLVRKLIPNEIADVAAKAAPFVAPFNPIAAGLMRGVGRYDKRGSLSDALKQGLLTYGFGKGVGKLGGAEGSELGNVFGRQRYSMENFRGGPLGRFAPKAKTAEDLAKKKLTDAKSIEKAPSFMKGITEATIGKVPILGNLNPMVQQKLLVGGITAGASALYDFFAEQEPPQGDNETIEQFMERRRVSVGRKMRNYMDNYFKFDAEYSALDDAGRDAFVARYNMKQGGRVGLAMGSPHGQEMPTFSEGVPQMFMSDELGALPKAEGGVSPEDMGILSVDDFDNVENYRRYIQALALEMARKEKPEGRLTKDDITRILNTIQDVKRSMPKGILQKAKGGRVSGYGGGITATMPRIPMGTPRVNAGGIRELDYRAEGGFVPVGVKEKADDVPAMLSKNEFVMTANAVKGAGGGSVEKGAQRMYNTMKKLEGRVA